MTTIDQSLLSPAVARCAQIANNTHPVPALQTIRLESRHGELFMEASNEISDISESVPAEGDLSRVCVNGSRFNNIIQSMSERIFLRSDNGHLRISDDQSNVKLPLTDPNDFPPIQTHARKAIGLSCPDLAKAINAVSGFSYTGPERDNLRGVQVDCSAKSMEAISTDGRMLSHFYLPLICAETRFMIPNIAVPEFIKALDREEAVIEQSERSIRVRHKSGHFSFRLLEVKFPLEQIRTILTTELTKFGQIDPQTIQNPLAIILSSSSDKKSANVDLRFSKDGIGISYEGEELDFSRTIPGNYPEHHYRVDGKRLARVLAAMDGSAEISTFYSGLNFKNKDLTIFLFAIFQANSKPE